MATIAQIDANRANAQLSTGPKSPEGKLASSSNALRTGLTSSKLFIRPADREAFDQLQLGLIEELKPQGPLQQHYFDVILHAAWNVQRTIVLEAAIQIEANAQGLVDALFDDTLSHALDRIYRYKKMHESSMRQATAELRRLQTEQLWRDRDQSSEVEVAPSVLANAPAVHQSISRTVAVHGRNKAKLTREAPPIPPSEEKAEAA